MKKSSALLLLCSALLIACGDKQATSVAKVGGPVPETLAVESVHPVSVAATVNDESIEAEMPLIARKNNCTSCHAIHKKKVGPAWIEVAKKYKGDATAEAKLILKVSKGGAGTWGSMPMPANDTSGTRQDEMRALVRFVLGLAK